MKLGILKAGDPPRALDGYGSYPAMFRTLLGEDRYDYREFDAASGELPSSVTACPAYLITGSASDAFGDAGWIVELKQFLNEAKGKAALIGICFGHQVMAEAFGGKVARSAAGWGLGNHTYDVVRPQSWTGEDRAITLPASHQDQVVDLPPASTVVACSAFSPFGCIAYNDQPAFSLQLHPEFEPEFATALVELRRGRGPDDDAITRAIDSLRQPNDRALAAGWIHRFIAANVRTS